MVAILSIAPTQVSVERAFSALKLVLSDLRANLNAESIDNILVCKLNSRMIADVVKTVDLEED